MQSIDTEGQEGLHVVNYHTSEAFGTRISTGRPNGTLYNQRYLPDPLHCPTELTGLDRLPKPRAYGRELDWVTHAPSVRTVNRNFSGRVKSICRSIGSHVQSFVDSHLPKPQNIIIRKPRRESLSSESSSSSRERYIRRKSTELRTKLSTRFHRTRSGQRSAGTQPESESQPVMRRKKTPFLSFDQLDSQTRPEEASGHSVLGRLRRKLSEFRVDNRFSLGSRASEIKAGGTHPTAPFQPDYSSQTTQIDPAEVNSSTSAQGSERPPSFVELSPFSRSLPDGNNLPITTRGRYVPLGPRGLAPTRDSVISPEDTLTNLSGFTVAPSVNSSLGPAKGNTTIDTSFTLPKIPTSNLYLDLDLVSLLDRGKTSMGTGQFDVSTPRSKSRDTTPEQDHWPRKVVSPPTGTSGSESISGSLSGRDSPSCESDRSLNSGSWQSCLEKISSRQPPQYSLLPISLLPHDIWDAKSSLTSDWFDGCMERSVV